LYVEQLIGPETVDTVPPATFNAFRDHGKVELTLEKEIDQAFQTLSTLEDCGISLKKITDELTKEGVESFAGSFAKLLEVIEARRDEAMHCLLQRHTGHLAKFESAFNDGLKKLDADTVGSRIVKKDPTLWKQDPAHREIIKNALGWLTVVELMLDHVSDLTAFAGEIKRAGYQHVVVLGMGGSSLCPEVLRRTFGKIAGYPELLVLDSTVPAAIRDLESKIDVSKTVFIVASKSGGTTEPQMFHHYFLARVKEKLGEKAGQNFIAITDPGTKLAEEAAHDGFRRVFLNPADIGGRY